MKLVIDTNIILSSLIKDSATRRILLFPSWKFIAPSITILEIEKHFDLVVKKSDLTFEEVQTVYETIRKKITIVPDTYWRSKLILARSLIGKRDPSDVPFLAVALCSGLDGIWSNDKDFSEQRMIRVWKTAELLEIISSEETE